MVAWTVVASKRRNQLATMGINFLNTDRIRKQFSVLCRDLGFICKSYVHNFAQLR
ncbi:hypothetical protein WUBG_18580 [Wuchereria bancrofti]|uniref:Uncharacterized protein n=1 Tax=Wuchereria bancrofti TaxID=6293 RepID=J9E0S5_WUCBA|nr:hypothetical protein WUBG_18580 [Wuchereria bancrofti]